MTVQLREVWSRAVEALRPPPVETLPQWIERTVRLPEGLSAEPGLVKLWPPQRAAADSIGDPEVERVTWLKAVRVVSPRRSRHLHGRRGSSSINATSSSRSRTSWSSTF
jgi:hypothetical protein